MSRFTEVNERYIAAWGKDHALGWFVDINPNPPELKPGAIVEVCLELHGGWIMTCGELGKQLDGAWGKWSYLPKEIVKTCPYDETVPVTIPDNFRDILEIYDDQIEGIDPSRNYVVSKSSIFDGITDRDVANLLNEHGFDGDMLVQTRE